MHLRTLLPAVHDVLDETTCHALKEPCLLACRPCSPRKLPRRHQKGLGSQRLFEVVDQFGPDFFLADTVGPDC